jgi:hypothetical protein
VVSANQTEQTFAVGPNPGPIAFDGAATVTKLRANDGVNLGTFSVGSTPVGVAFDGANIWVTNWGSGSASKL